MFEWMLEFPEFIQIPLADWIDAIMRWVLHNCGAVFEFISEQIILRILLGIEKFVLWLPWLLVVLLIGLAGWYTLRRWWAGLLMSAFLVIIGSFGYWDFAMMTLAIIITAVIVSLVIGIPTGITMARSHTAEVVVKPALDAMQTMPVFVYLIPAMT